MRLCTDHGALWVSDLPRRTGPAGSRPGGAGDAGRKERTGPGEGLWRLDWTAESWRERLDRLPIHPPALPRAGGAAPPPMPCGRLLMMHPAPVERQPLEQVREIAKLAAGAPGPLLAAVPVLTGEAARRLRWACPWPKAAGGCWQTGLPVWTQKANRRDSMILKYYGHSFFTLTLENGSVIAFDPYGTLYEYPRRLLRAGRVPDLPPSLRPRRPFLPGSRCGSDRHAGRARAGMRRFGCRGTHFPRWTGRRAAGQKHLFHH